MVNQITVTTIIFPKSVKHSHCIQRS